MEGFTWECRICSKTRPDDKISVLSYPLKLFSYVTVNTKYCNDNPQCFKGADKKRKNGDL